MNKYTYKITLVGCDDTTIVKMKLTEEEANLLQRVAQATKDTSEYGCQPIMVIHKVSRA